MTVKTKISNAPECQQGLTMIELMIAMLLGLVLMGGVVQIFLGSKQTYNLQEAQSRLQENGRLAMHFLPHDIRLTDFQGCRSRQNYTANIIATPTASEAPDLDASLWDLNGGITGSDNVVAGTIDALTGLPVVAAGTNPANLSIVAGTDVVRIQYGGSCGGNLIGNMTADNANIQISANNTCNLQQNYAFMITDCVDADVARASSVSNGGVIETVADANNVNIGNRLSKAYGDDAEIYSIQSVAYFIAENPNNTNSLYMQDNTTNPPSTQELVEGVQDLQILYGEDTDLDGTANYYEDAANVVAMQQVVSVRISLLMQSLSDNFVTTQPVTYTYNTATATATDRQLHKVFTSTVTLRNRLP